MPVFSWFYGITGNGGVLYHIPNIYVEIVIQKKVSPVP